MSKRPFDGLPVEAQRRQAIVDIQTNLAVVLNKIQNMEGDITEIKNGIKAINGGLRDNQRDIAAIEVNCANCKGDIDDLKKRMNIFSTIAAVSGGILGYFGSYFR
jgi:peptidoglycan hydrolase CwlO-like protein